MANPLPPGAIPKLYRLRNKDGQEVGAWYVKIKKIPVNLRTQDYFKARDRAKSAVEGKRDFMDDRYFDETASSSTTSMPVEPASHAETKTTTTVPVSDWTADAVRAAATSITPDEVIPPSHRLTPMSPFDEPPKEAPKEPEPAKAAGESTQLPPEMLDSLVKQIASMVVELQIHGQEWLAIRWGKFQPGTVAPDSKARELPTAIWEAQVREWLPSDVPLPAWLVAPIICAALTIPIQLEGATPIKKSS